MSNPYWDEDSYGPIEYYGVIDKEESFSGFRVGDRIICTDDYTDPATSLINAYESDEGTIVGVVAATEGGGLFNVPAQEKRLLVAWDETDPSSIDPSYIEQNYNG